MGATSVLDPEQKVYFEAPYRDTTKPSISTWEYRAAEKFLNDYGIKDADEDAIFRAREEMLRIEQGARSETKRQRRNRERKKHHAEFALPKADAVQQRRDGHLSLVVDNTGSGGKPGKGGNTTIDEGDFDFDDSEIKRGIEEW